MHKQHIVEWNKTPIILINIFINARYHQVKVEGEETTQGTNLGKFKVMFIEEEWRMLAQPINNVITTYKKLAHYCLVIWPTNNFGSHSLFLCGKPKRKQQMVFGLWLLHLVVTSYDYFLTNWLLILLNGKNILFNKINRGFEWKKLLFMGNMVWRLRVTRI